MQDPRLEEVIDFAARSSGHRSVIFVFVSQRSAQISSSTNRRPDSLSSADEEICALR
jgi:hypothetical protein